MNIKTPAAPQTSSDVYEREAALLIQQVELLKERLVAHRQRQAAAPHNWGFAGDMAHAATLVQEAVRMLS
jgi:hypothetical protein